MRWGTGMDCVACGSAAVTERPERTAGLSPVPLPRLRQAVQRTLRQPPEPHAVPLGRDRARGAVAAALPPDLARSGRDVPPPRDRLQLRSSPGVGGEARAGTGRRTPPAPPWQARCPRPPLARG